MAKVEIRSRERQAVVRLYAGMLLPQTLRRSLVKPCVGNQPVGVYLRRELSPTGRFTLLDHSALDDLLAACTERGVVVLAVSPGCSPWRSLLGECPSAMRPPYRMSCGERMGSPT
jgi:hypothetical protein